MKIAYAFRRSGFYPYVGDDWNLPGREVRAKWLQKVRALGYDGLELGTNSVGGPNASREQIRELRKELDDNGVPCVAVRGGGGLAHPRTANANRQRIEESIRFASQIGCTLVNTTVGTSVVTAYQTAFLDLDFGLGNAYSYIIAVLTLMIALVYVRILWNRGDVTT